MAVTCSGSSKPRARRLYRPGGAGNGRPKTPTERELARMTLAVITILSLFLSAISLGVAAQRSSAPLAWAGVVLLAIGLHPIYLPWLSRLPSFQELVTTTHATNEIDALCQETKRMAKLGRST